MRVSRTFGLALILALGAAVVGPALARADEEAKTEEGDGDVDAADAVVKSSRWGLGARFRYLFIPKSVLELFLDHATHLSSYSVAAELTYRVSLLDIVMSLDYSNGNAAPGLFLEKGDNANTVAGAPDYTEFDGFGLLSLDATFLWHLPLHDRVQLRGGAGLGVGLVLGKIWQTNYICTGVTDPSQLDDTSANGPCMPTGEPRTEDKKVPKVLPVVNLLLGFRIKITPDISLNLEGGFRNAFFLGGGVGYFF